MELSGRLLLRILPTHRAAAEAFLKPFDADICESMNVWSIAVPDGETEATLTARLREAERLASVDWFAWIRPDWRVFVQSATVVPNDPEYVFQWHHATIGSPLAWAATTGLREVTVAFVDTGIDLTHHDLVPNLVPGYCSYLTTRLPQIDNGIVRDAHGHGTTVAGVAAAIGNNHAGTAGIAWNVSIMPIRATNPAWPTGGATSMDIINGALWAADHGARIVNISFSGIAEPYVQDLGAALRQRRVLLIWPVDNYAIDYGDSFDHPDVLVVAGTNQVDQRSPASSFGDGVDISAPAAGIYTSISGGGAWYRDGNSFAAPMVAGAAALVLSAASELTPAQVEAVLKDTAADLGEIERDPYFGFGRIDVGRAIWLAPLRQFAGGAGAAPERDIRARYSIEDLYAQVAALRDLDGDGLATPADAFVLRDLLRYDEVEGTTFRAR